MAHMTLNAATKNYFVVITGQQIQVWKDDETYAMFKGDMGILADMYPEVIQELLDAGIIKPSKGDDMAYTINLSTFSGISSTNMGAVTMNENMEPLVIIAALAIYNNKTKGGLVGALAYLLKHLGCGIDVAIDIIATYDRYAEAVKLGEEIE